MSGMQEMVQVVWGEDDFVGIKISCRADANGFCRNSPLRNLSKHLN
jgi:uncharacterized protein with GYD domain